MVQTAEASEPYRRMLVAVDCSDHANAATDQAIRLAGLWGSEVVGMHAYAAALHDQRFRQMEGGLPEPYRREEELEHQRDVHDTLITRGLQLISDSYLDQTERRCHEAGLQFSRRGVEGRNYRAVLEATRESACDLLLLGAQGLGAVQPGLIGTVCERVVRRTPVDTLVIKRLDQAIGDGPILVALDGSPQSYGGLLTALELGARLGAPVHAIAVYDPYFHYVAFNRIAEVLSEEAGRVFRFQEQEKLHEEIIDSGLAKIYQSHLRIAESIAEKHGTALETSLLDGKPYAAILKQVEALSPSLLVLGKVGIHADDELDIGGNTQHLLRLADCNLLIARRTHVPDVVTVALETTSWTEEAEARMERVPDFVRSMARMAILRFAQERGHTVITASIVEEATAELMPGHAHRAMQEIVEAADAGEIGGRPAAAAAAPALRWHEDARALLEPLTEPPLRRNLELRAEKAARRDRAEVVLPDHVLPLLQTEAAPAADRSDPSDVAPAEPTWTDEARARLDRVPAGFMRDASRERVLEAARRAGWTRIGLEEVEAGLAQARQAMADAMQQDAAPAERSMPWDDGAERVLERVPEGYMRDLTAWRTEARAQRLGRTAITAEVVEEQFRYWQEHSERVVRELVWDAEAWELVCRAPPVVRGMVVREMEAGARSAGLDTVTADSVRSARRDWERTGRFHVPGSDEP